MNVLIVDDHPDAAELISELMTFWGHECQMALCARDALAVAKVFEPELVLLDIDLPDLSGNDLLVELCNLFSQHRPFAVAITGWPDVGSGSLAAGFDRCLTKPVN